jgi:hypothetical protein
MRSLESAGAQNAPGLRATLTASTNLNDPGAGLILGRRTLLENCGEQPNIIRHHPITVFDE